MEKNVGATYVRDGDVRKRPTSGIVWSIIWTIVNVIWITVVCMTAYYADYNADAKDILACVFGLLIATIIIGSSLITIPYEERQRIVEYRIHEYERWDRNTMGYKKYFITEAVSLYSKYAYWWHRYDWISEMSQTEIEKYCDDLDEDWNRISSYTTQEEAMLSIIEQIKSFITFEKADENVKIRNVKTVETFTFAELKADVAAGKYNDLNDERETKLKE